MRLLLDTHILLWWLNDDPALSHTASELIQEPENVIFISAVSMWEIWLKFSLDKLRLPEDFEQKLEQEGFEALPLTAAHARQVANLEWRHRDPFDRLLIAQAQSSRLRFLTSDGKIGAYGDAVLFVE